MKKLNLDFKKDILPHIIAILIFLAVTILFFSPVFFDNQSLYQHDILQWEGGAKELIDYRNKTGEEGLWAGSMFSGMPGYLVNTKFSGDLLLHIQSVYTLFLPHPTSILFSALLSFYLLLLVFGVRPSLAMAGAILYGLASNNLIGFDAGHNARIAAMAYAPLVLGGVHLVFRKKYLWGFIMTAFGMGLHLRVNHLQITYYLLLIVAFYGLSQLVMAIKTKELPGFSKNLGILIAAVVLALACNLGKLWTVMEYSPHTTRGKSELNGQGTSKAPSSGLDKEYAFRYSNGIIEPFTLFVPNILGGSLSEKLDADSNIGKALKSRGANSAQIAQQVQALPTYWGKQPGTKPYYAGAILLFLFVLGLFILEPKDKYWLMASIFFGIILTWGHNLSSVNYFLFDYLPGYNKFRSVTFAIFMPTLGLGLFGFLSLEKLLKTTFNKDVLKKFALSLIISLGILILLIIYSWMADFDGKYDANYFGANVPDWLINALKADRAAMLRSDVVRAMFFTVAGAALFYFYLKEKLSSIVAFGLFALLTLIDIGLIGNRYLTKANFRRSPQRAFFAMNEADKFILKDKSPGYRVYNLQNAFSDARTSYHHHSIGGYHGAKMKRYQNLIERPISEETAALYQSIQEQGGAEMEKFGVLNMLNTKYIIGGTEARAVITNPDANGAAWIVKNVIQVNSPDEEIATLNGLDTKSTAVVDVSKFNLTNNEFNASGIVNLIDYSPKSLTYEAEVNGDALAVFSEIYYPKGWKATIDGQKADILRTNYVLRALEIPSGKHTIKFEFAPMSYHVGNTVSWIANLILIGLFFTGLYFHFVAPKNQADPAN